jgi:hypothetical protein
MIEFLVVRKLLKHIGSIARDHQIKPLPYQIMALLFWISGELSAAFIGRSLVGEIFILLTYGYILAGGLVGAGAALLVMSFITTKRVGIQSLFSRKFKRSIWVPILSSISAILMLGISFQFSIDMQIRAAIQNMGARNPCAGVQVHAGNTVQPVSLIPSDENSIYIGFHLENTQNILVTILLEWYLDGEFVHYMEAVVEEGEVVIELNREEIELNKFPEGHYEVRIFVRDKLLGSTEFDVIDRFKTNTNT